MSNLAEIREKTRRIAEWVRGFEVAEATSRQGTFLCFECAAPADYVGDGCVSRIQCARCGWRMFSRKPPSQLN